MKASAAAGKKHRITIVFDRQDEFEHKAHSVFNELLTSDLPYANRLGTLSFSAKDKVAALQAIDMIVNEVNRRWSDWPLLRERWQHELITDLISVKGALFDADLLQSMLDDRIAG